MSTKNGLKHSTIYNKKKTNILIDHLAFFLSLFRPGLPTSESPLLAFAMRLLDFPILSTLCYLRAGKIMVPVPKARTVLLLNRSRLCFSPKNLMAVSVHDNTTLALVDTGATVIVTSEKLPLT